MPDAQSRHKKISGPPKEVKRKRPAHRCIEVPRKPPAVGFVTIIEDPAVEHRASGAPCALTSNGRVRDWAPRAQSRQKNYSGPPNEVRRKTPAHRFIESPQKPPAVGFVTIIEGTTIERRASGDPCALTSKGRVRDWAPRAQSRQKNYSGPPNEVRRKRPAHRFIESPQKPPAVGFVTIIEGPPIERRASGHPCAFTSNSSLRDWAPRAQSRQKITSGPPNEVRRKRPAHRCIEVPRKPPAVGFVTIIKDPAIVHRASGAPCALTSNSSLRDWAPRAQSRQKNYSGPPNEVRRTGICGDRGLESHWPSLIDKTDRQNESILEAPNEVGAREDGRV